MPNDTGLRRCTCGRLIRMRDLIEMEIATASDLPLIDTVPDDELLECIQGTDNQDIEFAARLMAWRVLNHPYRAKYRLHRDAEEAATQAAWETTQLGRRSWWDKLPQRKASHYMRPPNSPFTYPAFEATSEQLQNMARLTELLKAMSTEALPWGSELLLAELLREQGRFDEARASMPTTADDHNDALYRLIGKLIDEREPAPMRYRG